MRKSFCVLILILSIFLLFSCGTGNTPDSARETGPETASETKKNDGTALFYEVCDADTALRLSVESNAVVIEQKGCTSGQETWDTFIDSVDKKLPASVICSFYYPGKFTDDGTNKCFFYLLEYDGNEYKLSIRESSSGENETSTEYKHLLHYTGDAPTPDALYSSYEFYVLTDDPDVTWEEIFRGMTSSFSGDFIKHQTVYINYSGWKGN
jgi:hypothetical protein